jgi:hypothetical protein
MQCQRPQYSKCVSIRTVALIILASFSDPKADALSGLGEFYFVNPGITLTKAGPGLELSAGKNGIEPGSVLLLGALGRYEFRENRVEAGMEFGAVFFLFEAGVSFSDRGVGEFIAPDLCIPIPLQRRHRGMAINLFYRIYPGTSGDNTFGGSLKVDLIGI